MGAVSALNRRNVFVGGPFSAALSLSSGQFDNRLRTIIKDVHAFFRAKGAQIYSSHLAEDFGAHTLPEDTVALRDNGWVRGSDAYVAVLPLASDGLPYRTDGTFVEIGLAIASGKPVILLMEGPRSAWSWYVRNLSKEKNVLILDLKQDHQEWQQALSLFLSMNHEAHPLSSGQQISNVDNFFSLVRSHTAPYEVMWDGDKLTVLPGVLSPKYSKSPEFFVQCFPQILPSDKVLDLGCGTGVLGLAALKRGAAWCDFADINPKAVKNAQLNINNLGLSYKASTLLSDGFENIIDKYDLIMVNLPYWDKPAHNMLDRSCFDEGHQFLQKTLGETAKFLTTNGRLMVGFSDQGNLALAENLIASHDWHIDRTHLQVAKSKDADTPHVRIIWSLRPNTLHAQLGLELNYWQKLA